MVLELYSVSERCSQGPSPRHPLIKRCVGPIFSWCSLFRHTLSSSTSRRSRAFARCCRRSLRPCSPSGPLPSAASSPLMRPGEEEEPWRLQSAPSRPGKAYPAWQEWVSEWVSTGQQQGFIRSGFLHTQPCWTFSTFRRLSARARVSLA